VFQHGKITEREILMEYQHGKVVEMRKMGEATCKIAKRNNSGRCISIYFCWACVIFFACVCVGASDTTIMSDDPLRFFSIFSGSVN
jgi:hypothetical protein